MNLRLHTTEFVCPKAQSLWASLAPNPSLSDSKLRFDLSLVLAFSNYKPGSVLLNTPSCHCLSRLFDRYMDINWDPTSHA